MLLHAFGTRADAGAVMAAAAGAGAQDQDARRFADVGLLAATSICFALGAATIEQFKHLTAACAGPLAGLAVLPGQRTLRPRLAAIADAVRGWLNRADDPSFWARAGAVCRLYLSPPPGTVLISIDEKTGIQAKTRTRPDLPGRAGRDARREFEYVRHGTVSIVAAMNVATGEVISQRIARNDSVTFISFLATTGPATPRRQPGPRSPPARDSR